MGKKLTLDLGTSVFHIHISRYSVPIYHFCKRMCIARYVTYVCIERQLSDTICVLYVLQLFEKDFWRGEFRGTYVQVCTSYIQILRLECSANIATRKDASKRPQCNQSKITPATVFTTYHNISDKSSFKFNQYCLFLFSPLMYVCTYVSMFQTPVRKTA